MPRLRQKRQEAHAARDQEQAGRAGNEDVGGAEKVGDGTPQERARGLTTHEHQEIDRHAARADPGGKGQLNRRVERREGRHPRDAGEQQKWDHDDKGAPAQAEHAESEEQGGAREHGGGREPCIHAGV